MTRRGPWIAVGVGLLAAALLLAPPPPTEEASTLSALGRSMGGLRIGLVDMLFLRAERLRREGRVDELPGLYRAVLELDPDNAVAVDHLVAVYAYDLRIESNDPEERYAWWRRALALLEDGLKRHPDDPSLHLRMSDLLLEIPAEDATLKPFILRTEPDARSRAVSHLFRAARLAPTLPRRGRLHLLRLALLLPVWILQTDDMKVAADLWTRGQDLLSQRRATLQEMTFPLGPLDPDSGEPSTSSIYEVFEDGLDVANKLLEAPLQGPTGGAEQAARAFVERYPKAPLTDHLR